MTYKIGMTFPTVQFGNVRLELEADTPYSLETKLDEAMSFMGKAFATYQFIQNGPDEALEGAVAALKDGLGATVLTEDPKAPMGQAEAIQLSAELRDPNRPKRTLPPRPQDDVKPAWERPADPTPAPPVTVSQSDIDDF